MARPTLANHRKFRRLARVLGSRLLARGALEQLWDACYESGEPYVGTADDLEQLVDWAGVPGALAAALLDAGQPEGAGFIEPSARTVDGVQTYQVHDLYQHAPDYVARRRRREQARQTRVDPSVTDRSVAADRGPMTGRWRPGPTSESGPVRTPAPAPAPVLQKEIRPAGAGGPPPPITPIVARAPQVRDYQRFSLFAWQRMELERQIGPALLPAFGLDAWLAALDADLVARPRTMTKQAAWDYVQAQLQAECRARGLLAATAGPDRDATIAAGLAEVRRQEAERGIR